MKINNFLKVSFLVLGAVHSGSELQASGNKNKTLLETVAMEDEVRKNAIKEKFQERLSLYFEVLPDNKNLLTLNSKTKETFDKAVKQLTKKYPSLSKLKTEEIAYREVFRTSNLTPQ